MLEDVSGESTPEESTPEESSPFLAWLGMLSDELDLDLADHLGSPEVRGFLRGAYDRNGAMSAPYFAPLLAAHRRELAERTVTALLARAREETGRAVDVPVFDEPPSDREPTGSLTVGHERIRGIDPVDIAVETAEGVQTYLADRHRAVWPLCPTHRVAPHPARTVTGGAWVCSVGAHVVEPLPR